MPSVFILIFLILIICWLSGLTYFFWRLFLHYNNLTKGSSSRSLQTILDTILKETQTSKKNIDRLQEQYATIEKQGQFHIQKIGLLRFNPFKDTGGDQSFILALLDGKETGVVISGLYSRAGTRWFAKKIINGKGVEYELSDEEKKAIKEAKSA
ncbi:MAG TPA: DUF4446 family protein [Candidatus Saccharimonadales bacterium]|nr:DUF4446 family protein [Candidatus Saccharimonadales bacterium]